MKRSNTNSFVRQFHRTSSAERSNSGQGLTETAAGLLVFSLLFSGCLLIFFNAVILSNYQRTVSLAATKAAKVIAKQQFDDDLGSYRPDFDKTTAEANARLIADFYLQNCGLPKTSAPLTVDYLSQPSGTGIGNINVIRVTCTVEHLPAKGSLFLPFVSMSGLGIAASAEVPPYALMTIAVSQQGTGPKTALVPAYAVADSWGSTSNLIQLPQLITPTNWANYNFLNYTSYTTAADCVSQNLTTLPPGTVNPLTLSPKPSTIPWK